jgi:hypothetical protein
LKPTKTLRNEQKRAGISRDARVETEIDRILAADEELIPSSGFLASVMERVQEEAALPPRIPFPWSRAVPGILLLAGVFGWSAVELIRHGQTGLGLPALSSLALAPSNLSPTAILRFESAGWVAFALGASLVSWLLSRRLAGRSGLF